MLIDGASALGNGHGVRPLTSENERLFERLKTCFSLHVRLRRLCYSPQGILNPVALLHLLALAHSIHSDLCLPLSHIHDFYRVPLSLVGERRDF